MSERTGRTPQDVGHYYDQNLAMAEATGAGLIWFMGKDHLSPPLSNNDRFALQSAEWREASSQRVLALATRMDIKPEQQVLDLGAGIGGPGRDVAQTTQCDLYGISISIKQLENLRRLSLDQDNHYTKVVKADMQSLPFAEDAFDHVFSINAIYHVSEPDAVISNAYRVLRPGGKFGVDDWFTTDQTAPETLDQLRHNWSTSAHGFHHFDGFATTMQNEGFEVTDVIDYTDEAGNFLSEKRFGQTYDEQIAPVLLDAFPALYQYEGYEPAHAQMAVAQLRSDILYMGELYRNGQAVYRQIIGKK